MANLYNFSSDQIHIFMLLLDKSGSMENDEERLKSGFQLFKESFKNFPEKDSIAVSICMFNGNFYEGDFVGVEELNVRDYIAEGSTALHYSIVEGANKLTNYVNKVSEINKCMPNSVSFVVFSDGKPWNDRASREDAKEAIKTLNLAGVTTAFVAFGDEIESRYGDELGFKATIDVNDREALTTFLGFTLPQSVKIQSKSMKPLDSNFFSQAIGTNSESYSSPTTAQALEDTSWIDEI